MAKGKKGFVLYADQIETFTALPDDMAGKLIKHIFKYVNDEDPETDDLVISIAFAPIKTQLKRDLKKYEERCKRNKDNGLKGGRPKTDNNPEKPSGLFGNRNEPRKPDIDNDKDNDSDKERDKDIKEFKYFWEQYHTITRLPKTDREAAVKKWRRLKVIEKNSAVENIRKYYDSLRDKSYCKKARTYLDDKNFNDDFTQPQTEQRYGIKRGTSTYGVRK